MTALMVFSIAQPFWFWLVIAAVLLAAEVVTGTGWLLWPAVSAGVVATATLVVRLPLAEAGAMFAMLTIASTYLGRRFLTGPPPRQVDDLNDMSARIVGLRGQAASAFARGQGRVLIEGNEWAAKADLPLAAGDAVEVVGVDGALLHVRRA